jgi:hypothetical protein
VESSRLAASQVHRRARRRTDGGLRWGVEPICAVLPEHGCPIAPSTYYAARTAVRAATQQPSRREMREQELEVEIARVHAENYVVYGARRCGWRSTAKASRSPSARSSG